MQTEMRGAHLSEYPLIREILARAFETEDEAKLWDYLVKHDASLRPEGVRLTVVDGRPVACTVVLPRQIQTRRGWVAGAIVTLVAGHPDHQNQGFGGRSVQDAVAKMAGAGLALGILYGHPDYYPRFGFAPVLPRWATTMRVAVEAQAKTGVSAVTLRPAAGEDLPALLRLYDRHVATYPCAVARTAEPWLWWSRNSRDHVLLVLPDREGYAFVALPPGEDRLIVQEAGAEDPAASRRLLNGLFAEAGRFGKARLELSLPPDHLLARLALLEGAGQRYDPAAAGMAVITNWAPLLPEGYRVEDGQAGRLTLLHQDRPLLWANRQALTQLVVGYRGIDDLLLAATADGAPVGMLSETGAAADDVSRLRRDFAPAFPKWSLAPFWH